MTELGALARNVRYHTSGADWVANHFAIPLVWFIGSWHGSCKASMSNSVEDLKVPKTSWFQGWVPRVPHSKHLQGFQMVPLPKLQSFAKFSKAVAKSKLSFNLSAVSKIQHFMSFSETWNIACWKFLEPWGIEARNPTVTLVHLTQPFERTEGHRRQPWNWWVAVLDVSDVWLRMTEMTVLSTHDGWQRVMMMGNLMLLMKTMGNRDGGGEEKWMDCCFCQSAR